ncbi:TPA: hypothetical protein ACQ3VS_002911 [Clostridium perfringens]
MKKSDLENGMVVEWRNGTKLIKVNDIFLNLDDFSNLDSFGENLKFNLHNNSGLDIVKIYKVNSFATDLKSIFKAENLTLIWERPKEIDWSKVPKWTKVQVKFPGEIEWENYLFTDYLPNNDFKFCVAGFKDDEFTGYEATRQQVEYCRIHESVEIKEEWYKE